MAPLHSFLATEILRAKINFEVFIRTLGVTVMDYQSYNGVFSSKKSKHYCSDIIIGIDHTYSDAICLGTIYCISPSSCYQKGLMGSLVS